MRTERERKSVEGVLMSRLRLGAAGAQACRAPLGKRAEHALVDLPTPGARKPGSHCRLTVIVRGLLQGGFLPGPSGSLYAI